MPRSKNFHGLKRLGGGKIRQTWNKINLYNLARWPVFGKPPQTFFQQKWKAKSVTRAYHGEHILEGHWKRMFRSRFRAVVPMSQQELASNDGSVWAEGRGSGLEEKPSNPPNYPRDWSIPYMQMTYAPMERRLDTAIFRALFASSARQARQFVVHGRVKVNGKKMPYPGYMLNPGDMFQVDPEAVMFATGAPKSPEAVRAGQKLRKTRLHEARVAAEQEAARESRRQKAIAAQAAKDEQDRANAQQAAEAQMEHESLDAKQLRKRQRKNVEGLIDLARILIRDTKNPPSGKRKVQLRTFIKTAKEQLNKSIRKTSDQVEEEIIKLTNDFAPMTQAPTTEAVEQQKEEKTKAMDQAAYKKAYQRSLEALTQARFAASDDTKPYATPWTPRPYMSAFAFIPEYLEVNQKICSAVYLRHPVAKPGSTEVPTPFPEPLYQLAFNWYLRNGR
ncbi:S4 domain-containing protein [Phlyctema vagabunda]|uniref:S4 domain-containing protein n=1 Tax=Phlyctema vagabunda TaxID=108571 RepID=A0ABR4P4U0_9HELO